MTIPLPASSRTSTLGQIVVISAAASISFSNILTPMVYALGTNSLTLLGLRYAGFLLVCGLWLKSQGISISLNKRDLVHCAGAGTSYAFGSACLITSFAYIPVSLAILVFYLFPLITRLAESALDKRVPSLFEIACYILALSGLAICLGVGLDDLNIEGLLFAVLAALGLSTSYVWTGRRLKSVQPVVLTFTMAATAGAFDHRHHGFRQLGHAARESRRSFDCWCNDTYLRGCIFGYVCRGQSDWSVTHRNGHEP